MNNSQKNRNNPLIELAPFSLFLLSYSPLFAIVAFRQVYENWDFLMCGEGAMESFLTFVTKFGVAFLCVLFILFGLFGSKKVLAYVEKDSANGVIVEVNGVSCMNDEPIGYLATYIISIMFQDYSNLSDVISLMILFFIIYRLYIHSKLLLVNPILGLKYSIYRISYLDGEIQRQGVVIAKSNDIQEVDQIKIYNIGYQLFYGVKRA